MTKGVLTLLLVAATLVVGYPISKKGVELYKSKSLTHSVTNEEAKETVVSIIPDLLAGDQPKTTTVKDTLVLEGKNTVVFRGPVGGDTVANAIKEISALSKKLSKSDPIYLVLDTPGGSVFDGADFIDFLEGIPQEVKTVTIFAASMGFQIAENNPGERLISRNGILMSHRAAGEVGGQFSGELESRYKMYKRKIDFLDVTVSNRMGISYEEYQKKIVNEYWIHGFDAVSQKVADKMVLLQCGSSLVGTTTMKLQTLFGPVTLVFDRCPLLRDPISASFDEIRKDAKDFVSASINLMFTDRTRFVKEIVNTDKFHKLFR